MLHFPTSCYLSVNFSMPRLEEMSSGKKEARYKDDSNNISWEFGQLLRESGAFVRRK